MKELLNLLEQFLVTKLAQVTGFRTLMLTPCNLQHYRTNTLIIKIY
ncbi:hypothetical protein BH09BAC3_BH09BAC3_28650 [soil metagenome]